MLKLTLKKDITSELKQAIDILHYEVRDLNLLGYISKMEYVQVHKNFIEQNIYINNSDLKNVTKILENTTINIKEAFKNE